MQKKFVTNLAFLLFLNLLIKPFHVLFVDIHWQNTVGHENFGLYFALFNFSFVFNVILDFGITNFNNINIAQNSHLLTKHFSSLVVIKFLLAVIYIIMAFVVGRIIGYDYRLMKLMLLLGFNQFLISFIAYLRSNIAGLLLFWVDSIISVLDRIILIAISLVLFFGHVLNKPLNIMHYVYAQTFAYGLTVVIAFFVVLSKTDFKKFKVSRAFATMIFKKSFPYATLGLLMACGNRLDAVMVERILPNGAEQAGIYAQGFRLLDSANMISVLFAGILIPIFARMIKQKESVEPLIKTASILLITPGVVVAIGCYFYSTELMRMLYGESHLAQASTIFPILMSCFILYSMQYIFGSLLTAHGNLRELNLIAASVILINITMNIFLIPRLQATGSAISSFAAQFVNAIMQVLIAQNVFKFKINYRLILTIIVFSTGVILINYFSKELTSRWLVNFGIMVLASLVWAFAIGMLNIKSMVRIMRYG